MLASTTRVLNSSLRTEGQTSNCITPSPMRHMCHTLHVPSTITAPEHYFICNFSLIHDELSEAITVELGIS